ncbi:ShlB/FhaC/HecB family hemolysin secretion/activation protein [Parahaliea aestuarii]|uniref:ShlB/FhaC/HecB family hemolysin secretion/activation protein n=1 Tax=Parahaliea aestuarii TaxID=1852021 RepID=A0A5C8ZY19_9GAMM|nr:ShlB/FhaC/HecB family hemolysin secretion/activation protein [Parahaliea aestuarii]TXS93386.1 ShlB/FhaC/HecB family hemolysin secretion/activation protein [Parahaliea aestuarii]
MSGSRKQPCGPGRCRVIRPLALAFAGLLLSSGAAASGPFLATQTEWLGQRIPLEVYADQAAGEQADAVNKLLYSAHDDAQALQAIEHRFSEASLAPLADYLFLLFPELDIGAPVSLRGVQLNSAQLDQLFNIYFNLQGEALPASGARSEYLDSIGFSFGHFLARRFTELARENGECLSASARGERRALPESIVIDVVEDPESCSLEANAQTVWVNHLALDNSDTSAASTLDTSGQDALLEERRRQAMGFAADSASGIPAIELLSVVEALGALYTDSVGGSNLQPDMQLPLMLQLDKVRRPLGVNFEELKQIADSLQVWYRQQGYFLANVYVPQQEFRRATGELELKVSFGVLGDVVLRNAEELYYSPEIILNPFRAYIGQEVTRDIYSAYFSVNDLPGVTIESGLFEPGDRAGETRLVLDVRERRFQLSLVADNYGSEFTGEQRYLALADWLGPLGLGDELNLGILQSTEPSNSTYGFVSYRVPVFGTRHELTAAWNTHNYESIDSRTGTSVLIVGDVTSAFAGYNFKWLRSREVNMEMGLQGYQKRSELGVSLPLDGNVTVSEQTVEVQGAELLASGDFLQRQLRAITGWQASLLYGERKEPFDPRLGKDYTRLLLNSDTSMLIPLGINANRSHLGLRFTGSYSEDVLPSFEQTPLGGPYGVRAYDTSDFTADSLAYASLQWQVDIAAAWLGLESARHSLKIGPFLEGGYGEANAVGNASSSSATLWGYGLALDYSWRNRLSLETSLAFAGGEQTSDDFSGEISNDDYRFLFTVRYAVF